MAYTKILVIHNRLDKCLDYAQDKEKTSLSLAEAIDYALNRDKTEQACFETGINCDVEAAWRDMLSTKRRWGKAQRKRQGYHIIQSFAPGEVTPEEAHAAGVEFARRLFGERYEAIVTTHLNKAHLHNHVVVNSVSMLDGTMYRDTFQEYYGGDGAGIRGTSDAICQEHGLSVIEPDPENPDRRRSRPEWEGKTAIRDTVRRDIDAALGRAYTLQSLLQELRCMGYQVQAGNRKHISIRPPGGGGNIRLDSLGDGYNEADLKARLEAIRTGRCPDRRPRRPRGGPPAGNTMSGAASRTAFPVNCMGFKPCASNTCISSAPSRRAVRRHGRPFPRARNLSNWTAINGSFDFSTKTALKRRNSCPCSMTPCKRRSTPSRTGAGTCTACGGPAMRKCRRRSATLRPNCGHCAAT